MPTSQPAPAVVMNRPILVRKTGTPTWRDAPWAPPTAKIQLPARVRSRIHDAMIVTTIHQITDTWIVAPPTEKVDPKIFCGWS